MEVLVVIPARSGSKGISHKNILTLDNKPLLAHSIEVAKKSEFVTRVVVNTDSKEYASIAEQYGADVPFLRAPELSGDQVFSVEVVVETLEKLEENEGYKPDLCIMLLPTSPLRSTSSLDKGIRFFEEPGVVSVVSVTESDKQVQHFRKIDEQGVLNPIMKFDNLNVQRQDLQKLYVLNGSIYISTPASIKKHRSFHIEGARALKMPWFESVDINNYEDFHYAEWLIDKRRK